MLTHLVAATGVLGMLTVVPGPDMAVVTRRALAAGPGDGLRTVGGIVTGLLLWGAPTAAGLAAVLAASPAAYLAVKLLGAGYLVFLGAQALWQHRATAPAVPTGTAPTGSPWRTGLVSNILNPKIAVFYTGLLPSLAPPGLPTAWAMTLLVLLHTALTLRWLGGYVLLLAKAGPVLHRPRIGRALGRTTGVVLIGFGLLVSSYEASASADLGSGGGVGRGRREVQAAGGDRVGAAVGQPVGQAHHGGAAAGDLVGQFPGAVHDEVDGVPHMSGDELLVLARTGGLSGQHTGRHPLYHVP